MGQLMGTMPAPLRAAVFNGDRASPIALGGAATENTKEICPDACHRAEASAARAIFALAAT
jgi:hypothetical protein